MCSDKNETNTYIEKIIFSEWNAYKVYFFFKSSMYFRQVSHSLGRKRIPPTKNDISWSRTIFWTVAMETLFSCDDTIVSMSISLGWSINILNRLLCQNMVNLTVPRKIQCILSNVATHCPHLLLSNAATHCPHRHLLLSNVATHRPHRHREILYKRISNNVSILLWLFTGIHPSSIKNLTKARRYIFDGSASTPVILTECYILTNNVIKYLLVSTNAWYIHLHYHVFFHENTSITDWMRQTIPLN